MKSRVNDHIVAVLDEVMPLMRDAFARENFNPVPGSALDQVGLLDGDRQVTDFVEHGEPELALDHLLYMIVEAELPISLAASDHIMAAAEVLGVSSAKLASIRRREG